MNPQDKKFMLQALVLAEKGIGSVEPNPAVGCVIVKNGRIIGRGWHKKFGGPHAEINALNDCLNKQNNPAGSTMYVTLEPCCHYGKTPPCTNAIIKAKIKKVVAAVIDPSPHANGKGLAQLKNAGIEVVSGLCKKQARYLNAPFFKFATASKPWIIIKWAQSKDGFLASKKQRWISNEESRADSQKLRRGADAILVGINTVLSDNPLLTARPPAKDKKLLRVVLDSRLKIPIESKLVKTAKKIPVLVFTILKNSKKKSLLEKKGVEIVTVSAADGKCNLKSVLDELAKRGIQQLLVEGGLAVITSFLKAGLADEIVVYTAPKKLGRNGLAPATKTMHKCLHALDAEKEYFGGDLRIKGLR
jgi:diaminohydroxyphosphoribosylaminopyrimidine deaminase/5-amino-6-(5-phosphoribosylamino)uracil reductase